MTLHKGEQGPREVAEVLRRFHEQLKLRELRQFAFVHLQQIHECIFWKEFLS